MEEAKVRDTNIFSYVTQKIKMMSLPRVVWCPNLYPSQSTSGVLEEKWREGRGGKNVAGRNGGKAAAGRMWREEMAGIGGGRGNGGREGPISLPQADRYLPACGKLTMYYFCNLAKTHIICVI